MSSEATATQRIAAFTSALTLQAVPPDTVEKAKVTLLHNLGVALAAGSMARTAVAYADAVAPYDGGSGARLLVSGRAVSPSTAAYVNAALVHARAQDDVYFPGLTHVGATTIPALLALGEARDSSGAELLTAMVAGYEAAGAVSGGFAPRTTARGFRATGLFGVFGAAAASARLLGLDAEATANAMGLAACASSGTNQTWVAGTQEWQFQVGVAATAGLRAAVQAAAGGTAAPDSLEGIAGFYNAFMGDVDGVDTVGRELGRTWRITDVTYKPYPVCAILQAPVTELVTLLREADASADDIESMRIVLSPTEAHYPGTDSTGPFCDVGATLMSAQFCLAVAAQEGRVTAADLRRGDDPRIGALLQRVSVAADPTLTPRSFRLTIDVADGRRLETAFTATNRTYNWERHDVVAQLQSMVDEMPFGSDEVGALADLVLAVEASSVRQVVSACVTR